MQRRVILINFARLCARCRRGRRAIRYASHINSPTFANLQYTQICNCNDRLCQSDESLVLWIFACMWPLPWWRVSGYRLWVVSGYKYMSTEIDPGLDHSHGSLDMVEIHFVRRRTELLWRIWRTEISVKLAMLPSGHGWYLRVLVIHACILIA